MTEISIVISVYNVEKFLRRCLESVTNQTLQDIRIICVNDGSTDSSPKILEEFAQKDSRITVINQENKGASFASQAGIDAADTPYIGFVDADDWIEPETFETALHYMKNYDVDYVCWSAETVWDCEFDKNLDEEITTYHRVKTEGFVQNVPKELKFKTCVCTWCKLYITDLIKSKDNHYENGSRHEDDVFWFKYLPWAKNAYYIDKKFYNYVQRENSIMNSRRLSKRPKICQKIINIPVIVNYYKKHNIYEEYVDILFNKFMFFLEMDYFNASNEDKDKVLQKVYEIFTDTDFGSYNNHYCTKVIREKNFYKFKNLNIPKILLESKFLKIYRYAEKYSIKIFQKEFNINRHKA